MVFPVVDESLIGKNKRTLVKHCFFYRKSNGLLAVGAVFPAIARSVDKAHFNVISSRNGKRRVLVGNAVTAARLRFFSSSVVRTRLNKLR